MSRFEALAGRLEQVVADLDELSFDLLQEAAAEGRDERPPADRTLVQARRATEKAALLLRSLDGGTATDG